MKARTKSRRLANAMVCIDMPGRRPEGEHVRDSYDKFIDLDSDMSEVELAAFKRVFLSEDGQFVLGKILEKCKFMEKCDNERDMALNNFAKELMATIYWDRNKKGINIHRIIAFVKAKLRRK